MDAAVLESVAASEPTPEQALAEQRAAEARAAMSVALHRATAALTARERLLLRLRYEQGATVAEIARMLGEEPKPLYRHIERVLGTLRRAIDQRLIEHVRCEG